MTETAREFCAYCNVQSEFFPKCRLCKKQVCINHYTVIRTNHGPGGLECECSNHPEACFGRHAESTPDQAVGP